MLIDGPPNSSEKCLLEGYFWPELTSMFKDDIDFLTSNYLSLEAVEKQVELIRKGNPVVKLQRPAAPGDGILQLSAGQRDSYLRALDEKKEGLSICKFVPASGAATRMFKDIRAWIDNPAENNGAIGIFFGSIHEFAFYETLKEACQKNGIDVHSKEWLHKIRVLQLLIGEDGLGYASLPKALILFHKYGGEVRKAMAEHFVEGAAYARAGDEVHLHFTISPEHEDAFNMEAMRLKSIFEERYGVGYKINWSFQKPSTNTVALAGKALARDGYGNPLVRPGGHGALIENLNDLGHDVVFIKNIDNVCHESHLAETVEWKEVLFSILLDLKDDVHALARAAEQDSGVDGAASAFQRKWHINLPEKKKGLRKFLNRPIRVCGMVKNEGEPGGGPFWVENEEGNASLQIVEKAQVDVENLVQARILEQSTHFNPVDMVCYLKDADGNKFNLLDFVDKDSYLVTTKTQSGTELSVLEWPGLWNGGMADWITVFVEVPLATFNPVKTILDLQRTKHVNN